MKRLFPIVCALITATLVARKPNVVIIYTDDQKMDSFGFINGKAHTPHIDRLAREGAYFAKAYATSSVCSPSRYSCLTGQYASRCTSRPFHKSTSREGVTKMLWNMGIDLDEWTFAKVLQQHGYKTGMVGKWHVGLSGKHGRIQPVPNANAADPATKAVIKRNQEIVCKDIADRGFDYVGGVYKGNPNDSKNLIKTGCNVHAAEWQTKHALDFIQANKDEPFCLYYATTLLHSPAPFESLTGDPRLTPLGLLDEPITGVMPAREDTLRRAKAAGITEPALQAATWLDDVVGVVRAKLEALGVADNTMIVYFNDNSTDDSGKGSCYEGGAHVPMIVHMPGVVTPGQRDQLVANIDIAPTIFDLCDVIPPNKMHLDGDSLLPLLRGQDVPWRDALYLEIGLTRAVVSGDYKYLAFRIPPSYLERTLEDRMAEHRATMAKVNERLPWTRKHWKLDPEARFMQMGMSPGGDAMERMQLMGNPPFRDNYYDPDQLYHLKRDPRETTNLADNPEYATVLKRMKSALAKLLDDVPGTFGDLKESP